MARQSEFDKFKSGMAATRSLGAALHQTERPAPVAERVQGARKPASKKQVSFYIDQDLYDEVAMLKATTRKSFSDIYEEALRDILSKYGR